MLPRQSRRQPNRLPALLAGALLVNHAALAQTERQHGAHVHGTSILDVALDGATLSVHLDAPGINLLGFEHPPRDAAERTTLAAVLQDLKTPTTWLVPAADAGCRLTEARVVGRGLDENPSSGSAGAGAAADAGHADFDADYRFDCAKPERLTDLEVRLVARYSGTRTVTVNVASANGQTSSELSGSTRHAYFPASP